MRSKLWIVLASAALAGVLAGPTVALAAQAAGL